MSDAVTLFVLCRAVLTYTCDLRNIVSLCVCMMSLKDKLNVLETFAYSLRQWIPAFPEFPKFPGMTFFHSRFPEMKNHYRE